MLPRAAACTTPPRICLCLPCLTLSHSYHIEHSDGDAAFFPGRSGQIMLNGRYLRYETVAFALETSQLLFCLTLCRSIGVIGVIHPTVASNFSVPFACSGLEMDIEHFSVKK
jgi:phenylalanyl-tRNA synthetase beta subunit